MEEAEILQALPASASTSEASSEKLAVKCSKGKGSRPAKMLDCALI